jgi:hypothetical protein
MGAMLKISIVMLTTAAFAGLLVADPYGPSMMNGSRRTAIVAANVQAAPGNPQAQHQPSSIAKPLVQPDTPVAQEATNVAVAANRESGAPASALTPARPQLGRVTQERSERRDRVRAMPDRYIHTASLTNVARHVRRHV